MIRTLAEWVRTMAAGALFCAVVLAVAPEGGGKRALRLLCAVCMVLLLLRPLSRLDTDRLAEGLSRQRLLESGLAAEAEGVSRETWRRLIREKTEEYIWTAAAGLGISRLGVRLTLRDGEENPYPYAAELRGSWTEGQRERLSWLLAGELGIPITRQTWSLEDAG